MSSRAPQRPPKGPPKRAPRAKAPEDPELAAGSSAHYEDPAYYHKTYARRRDDVEFYVGVARDSRGPILEYGCGNGRITLPLARAGHAMVGVDLSAPMLADFASRVLFEPDEVRARVQLKRGDMRSLRLGRRFGLVLCPFNAFLHLYTRDDVERFLGRVREHLAPRGRFVFDVSVPDPSELARKAEKLHKTPPFHYPDVGPVSYGERFDYDALRQVLFVAMEFTPKGGAPPFMTPLAHRQFYPQELEMLLHYNGFAIERMVGDFEGSPTPETRHLAIVARPRPAR